MHKGEEASESLFFIPVNVSVAGLHDLSPHAKDRRANVDSLIEC